MTYYSCNAITVIKLKGFGMVGNLERGREFIQTTLLKGNCFEDRGVSGRSVLNCILNRFWGCK